MPTTAKCVIIGAGIVGNCLVGHLSRLGWTDMVQIDKGPLPNPGGSTGHASNFIFPTDHNKEMAFLTLESQQQYIDHGLNNTSGGIEVARKPERLEEFKRRMTSAKAWGIDSRLVTPAEIKELVPFINEEILLGGFYTPSVSCVDSLETGTQMRNEAVEPGALQVFANTEVLDIETEDGPGGPKVTAVVTNKGRIEAEYVAIACGVWSPRIAKMAGANIPLTPAVHQMADVGPIDILQQSGKEVAYPIVRDMDTFCYERQTAGSMEVGSYAHRPIFMHPDDIPSNEESALSPTELPFTADDFDQQFEEAIDLMDMLGEAEIRYAINGLLSLTPDANPVLGETVEVRNLWSAAAVWIKEGPGIAQIVAEWMTYGYPHLCDPHSTDISRFYPHEKTEHHILARCAEHFNKTYGIVHPREQWASQRGMRRSPFYAREEALGAVFFDARGWERPQWFESNAKLMEKFPEACKPRQHEWDARWWSPITNAEHLQMRESVGMVDLTAFNEFDITGPGAMDYLQYMCVNNVDVAVGRSVYTPLLTQHGGFRGDLTIQRLGDDHFRIITGAFDGGRDNYWFRKYMPTDGSVTFTDRSQGICTHRRVGPERREDDGQDRHRSVEAVRRVAGRVPVRRGARGADRRRAVHHVPHLLRRRERLGDLHQHGARPAAVGHHRRGRQGVRHHPRRHRRVRRHRSHREGLPPDGCRARERVQPGRGRARSTEGEVGRLHGQGGLPQGPRAKARQRSCARCRWIRSSAPTATTASRPVATSRS